MIHQMTFTASDITASTDLETRIIEGIAVPYNEQGLPGGAFAGTPVMFRPGALTRSLNERSGKVKLIVDHDRTRPIGRLTKFTDTPTGLNAKFTIARTPAGDAVLAEAADGVRDSFSVGVAVLDHTVTATGIEVIEARLEEVSLVSFPAFAGATVDRVAATEQAPARGTDPRVIRLRHNLRK
jgi:HK97 family phage prohead protease